MKSGYIKVLLLLMVFSLLLTCITYAEPAELQTEQNEQTNEQTEFEQSSENQTRASSSANPFPAYLGVAAVSYAAPSPVTGYAQETVPANTNIWIVEKVYCVDDGNYYYYAGYGYNSASHRGYFCENVVYYNGSVLNYSNISDEYAPADYKAHSSLPGTVYDGPGTSYSVMGSVEQETVKLIRTDGDYNFIEYTVTGTGKLKRGYLHYSKITGSWAYLTSLIASKLDGKTFFVRNAYSGKYLDVKSWSTAENGRLHQYRFLGKTNQIFYFKYNSAGKYFTIQPANNYVTNRRLSINLSSSTDHNGRHLTIQTAAEVLNQRFWIVEVTLEDGVNKGYKILPLSSYGTMTLTNCSDFINQCFTYSLCTVDTWVMESTTQETDAVYQSQLGKNWCWAASAYSMASAEPNFRDMNLTEAIQAYRGNTYNVGGTVEDRARLANYYLSRDKNSGDYQWHYDKIYHADVVRNFIKDGHPVGIGVTSDIGEHALTIFKFEWVDIKTGSGAPGYYKFYYYDSDVHELNNPIWATYESITQTGIEVKSYDAYWDDTAAYNTSYNSGTMNPYV